MTSGDVFIVVMWGGGEAKKERGVSGLVKMNHIHGHVERIGGTGYMMRIGWRRGFIYGTCNL